MPPPNIGLSTGGIGLAGAGRNVGRALGDEDNGVLTNFFNFLSRPGFAVRSLISGEPGDALRNVAQGFNELPFGGFVDNRFTVTNALNLALPEAIELPKSFTPDREDRPEFSDVLGRWGVLNPKSLGPWERLGVDIAGGIVTDPLTLLSGGAKTVGQNVLLGAHKGVARESLSEALKKTPQGIKALNEATDTAYRALRSRTQARTLGTGTRGLEFGPQRLATARALDAGTRGVSPRAEKLTALMDEIAAAGGTGGIDDLLNVSPDLLKKHGLSGDHVNRLVRGVEQRAAENVFWQVAGDTGASADEILRLGEHLDGNVLDHGLRALEREGLTEVAGALYWKVPFAHEHTRRMVPGTANFWSNVGRFGTAPGWVRGGLHSIDMTKPAAEVIDALAGEGWQWVKRLYDKFDAGKVAAGVKEAFRGFASELVGTQKNIVRKATTYFDEMAPEIKADLGTRLIDPATGAEALYHGITQPGVAAGTLNRLVRSGRVDFLRPGFDEAAQFRRDLQAGTLTGPVEGAETFTELTRQIDALGNNPIPPALQQQWEEARRTRLGPKVGSLPSYLTGGKALEPQAAADLVEKILAREVTEAHGRPVWETLSKVLTDFRAIPRDLVNLRIWRHAEANPFYIPHQGADLLFDLQNEALRNPALAADLSPAIARQFPGSSPVRDKFTQERKEWGDFLAELAEISNRHGINPADLVEEGHVANGLVNADISQLYQRRMFAHAKTTMRAQMVNKAGRLPDKLKGDALDRYLAAQLEPGNFRESFLGKFLGGGTFEIPAHGAPRFREWAANHKSSSVLAPRVNTTPGRETVRINWPGLNVFWKPLLTSNPQNVAFHTRNVGGAIFMSQFDPDVGRFTGFPQLWHAIRNSSVVRGLGTKAGWLKAGELYEGDDIARVVRYMDASTAEEIRIAEEGIKALKESGKRIGRYDWDEVKGALDQLLGERVNQADLMLRVGETDFLAREIFSPSGRPGGQGTFSGGSGLVEDVFGKGGIIAEAWQNKAPFRGLYKAFRRWTKLGQDIATSTEQRFRANMLLELLGKDVPIQTAIKKVKRAFVDYSVQSATEQFLRDTIPFARFTIGSTAWLKSIAQEPRLVSWMARAQGSAHSQAEEDFGFLPERLEDTLALPLPWKTPEGNLEFLLGLGLPAETSIGILGAATPDGFRKKVLAGLHPAGRLPLEATTDRSFYFGDDWGQYRRVPAWLRFMPNGAFQRIELPDGRARYEMDGRINEVLNALPTSRLQSIADKLFDENRNVPSFALNFASGARTVTINQEAEIKARLAAYLKDKADQGQVGEVVSYFVRAKDKNVDMPEDLKIILGAYQEQQQESRARARAREGEGAGQDLGFGTSGRRPGFAR
jgi:hypothetical protein